MKTLWFSVTLIMSFVLDCQSQTIENDTIFYQSLKYFPGRTVQIFFGSGKSGEFVHAFVGGRSRIIKDIKKGDLYPLSEHYAKAKIVVNKVFVRENKFYVRGELINYSYDEGELRDEHYIFIEIKGAVDDQEIWEDNLK
jgi:hypothetical protein